MANAAIVITNFATSGTVYASSQVSTMPVANLLTSHVADRWRSSGTNNTNFVLDLLSPQTADTIDLRGLTGSSSTTIRIRLSLTDSSGLTGEVDDSGTLGSTNFNAEYDAALYLLASPLSFRYVRVDISDSAASYVEAGTICVGLREVFTYNHAPGSGITTVDRSRKTKSSGGQTLTWTDNLYRVFDLSFGWISSTQRYGVFESMARTNGQHKNVLLILDTASTDLARDSIFGLVTSQTPMAWLSVPDIYSSQLTIEERL